MAAKKKAKAQVTKKGMRNPTAAELRKLDALQGDAEDAPKRHELLRAKILRELGLPRRKYNYQEVAILSDKRLGTTGPNGGPIDGYMLSDDQYDAYVDAVDEMERTVELAVGEELRLQREVCGVRGAGVTIDWKGKRWINRFGDPVVPELPKKR